MNYTAYWKLGEGLFPLLGVFVRPTIPNRAAVTKRLVKMRRGVILFHARSERPAQFAALEDGP